MARVLIVEDDALNLKMFAMVLKKAGHDVTTAEDGAAGLTALRASVATGLFEIVISDLRMPNLDGIGLVRAADAAGLGAIPFILLTAMGDAAFHGQNFPANVVAVLSKPISLEKLATEVAQIIARGGG